MNNTAIPTNATCPECQGRLTHARRPLVCHLCCRGFHLKCAKETRSALEKLRDSNTWTCVTCQTTLNHLPPSDVRVNTSSKLRAKRLTLLQWNCDYLATKIIELRELVSRAAVDVVVLQETKLGEEDPTPSLPGFEAIRRDRPGSGVSGPRGGGLLIYIKKGLHYTDYQVRTEGPLEAQSIGIPASKNLELRVTNLYLPPDRTLPVPYIESLPNLLNEITDTRAGIVCGDLNAHHPVWDRFVPEDRRGSTIQQWMEDTSRIPLNDGAATRFARYQQGQGCSSPDLTIVDASRTQHYSWSVLNELSSDHIPLLINWNQPVQVEDVRPIVKPNFRKADWSVYKSLVTEGIEQMTAESDIPDRLKTFSAILKDAAKVAVPRRVIREDDRPWMNSELRSLTRERNRLRRDMRHNREEWVRVNKLVIEKTKEAKRAVWHANLDGISEQKDARKAWEVVKRLSGVTPPQAGKTLTYQGRQYVTDQAKASAFVQEYAKVSGRHSDKSTRRANRQLKATLKGNSWSPRQESEEEFTRDELSSALWKVKTGKAAGPDELYPEMLKHLPGCAEEELLKILNYSWMKAWCPQSWRSVVIVPFLKRGKDSADISSYRPIALTSVLSKLLERLIANRLSWWLETKNMLSPWQAGFRPNRSTTDQCLRLTHFISDGFQSTDRERSVVTTFDFSKAYDTVWRTGLYTKMVQMGIPLRFVQWTSSWLDNRIARVRVNGSTGRSRTFKEGLPQGAVLSPLLFITYSNDLLDSFDDATLVSAFADDLALACKGRRKEDVEMRMQPEVDKVAEWSGKNFLKLNATKCEVSFFTMDSAEARWQPTVSIGECRLRCNPTPTFLGVTYDRQLTFGQHVQNLCQRISKRNGLLRLLGGKDWGWDKEDLRKVYIAICRSAIEYAAPAWTPWTSATNIARLERVQLQAARTITSLVKSSPTEAVLCEADLPPLANRFKELSLRFADKWIRLEPDDQRRAVLLTQVRQRLRKSDWRVSVTPTMSRLGLIQYEHTLPKNIPPWDIQPPIPVCYTNVTKAQTVEDQLQRTLEAISTMGPSDLLVFTDGSTSSLQENGGAGLVILRGNDLLYSWNGPSGRRSSSYTAEKVAFVEAVKWLRDSDDWQSAVIVCDCRSLIEAIGNPLTTDEVVQAIQSQVTELKINRRLGVLWSPGHCNLEGNDLADAQAKLGSTQPQADVRLDVASRRAIIRQESKPPAPSHPRVVLLQYPVHGSESVLTKIERVNLARFRSGHHPSLRRWQHLVGSVDSAACRFCAEDVETAEHVWLHCPAFLADRQRLDRGHRFDELACQPHPSMALLGIILRRLK